MGQPVMAARKEQSNGKEDQQRNICPHASRILQPFADIKTNDVQPYSNTENDQRAANQKGFVAAQIRSGAATDVGSHGAARYQQSGKIKEGINPIGPSSDKAVEIAERFTRPDIQSAFSGITSREFGDDQRGGNEEENCRQHPQAERGCPIMGSSGDPSRPEHSCDVE